MKLLFQTDCDVLTKIGISSLCTLCQQLLHVNLQGNEAVNKDLFSILRFNNNTFYANVMV